MSCILQRMAKSSLFNYFSCEGSALQTYKYILKAVIVYIPTRKLLKKQLSSYGCFPYCDFLYKNQIERWRKCNFAKCKQLRKNNNTVHTSFLYDTIKRARRTNKSQMH